MKTPEQRPLHAESAVKFIPDQADQGLMERPGNPRIYCNPRVFADKSLADFNPQEPGKRVGRWAKLMGFLGINRPFISHQND